MIEDNDPETGEPFTDDMVSHTKTCSYNNLIFTNIHVTLLDIHDDDRFPDR